MTKAEMQRVYEQSCAKANRPPDPSEFRAWMTTLGMFTANEVQDALVQWYAGSRFLPTAKELLPLAITSRNVRVTRASEKRQLVAWRCEVCNVTTSGYVSPQDRTPRFCRSVPKRAGYSRGEICGGNMAEVYREGAEEEPVPQTTADVLTWSRKTA